MHLDKNHNISPEITIIIPLIRSEKNLNRCLESIKSQNNINLEIICVVIAIAKETQRICEKLKSIDDRISIIHIESTRSENAARNAGILAAKGKYLLFMDASDKLVSDSLNELITFANDKNSEIICLDGLGAESRLQLAKFDRNRKPNKSGVIVNLVNHRNLIRADFLKKTKVNFDERNYCVDLIFSVKLALNVRNFNKYGDIFSKATNLPLSSFTHQKQKYLSGILCNIINLKDFYDNKIINEHLYKLLLRIFYELMINDLNISTLNYMQSIKAKKLISSIFYSSYLDKICDLRALQYFKVREHRNILRISRLKLNFLKINYKVFGILLF